MAADRAEAAYTLLSRELIEPPAGQIYLIVTDNLDLSNGLAGPFPRNRIIAYTLPATGEPSLANHDDWMGQLILHELVHVFHLDYTQGIWDPLRSLLGRDPRLFPEALVPGWLVEGLATYMESEYTAGGRARSSAFSMEVRAAALGNELFTIDRASTIPTTYPGPPARYLYGALFVDYLVEKHGAEDVSSLLREIGGQIIPYRLNRSARRALGESLTTAWSDWREQVVETANEQITEISRQPVTNARIVTEGGRTASYPRFNPRGALTYAASDGRGDPELRIETGDGEWRGLRINNIGPASWIDDQHLLVAQLDFTDPYNLRSDLYVLDTAGGSDRITRDGRVWEPSLRPGRREAVAVQAAPGTNILVRVDIDSGAIEPLTEPALDVYWADPVWSPDGERIAVIRWAAGSRADLVILDAEGRVQRVVTEGAALDMFPAWSPDGRYLLFTSDRTGVFNIHAMDLAEDRLWQVTNVLTGAFQGSVSGDSDELAFSYYQADGYHIARMPWDPAGWLPAAGDGAIATSAPAPPSGEPESRPYSSWPTLRPTYWSPILDVSEDTWAGLGLSGEDLVQRHRWWVEALMDVSDPRLMGGFGYSYRGLGNPVLSVGADQRWVRFGEGDTRTDRREREIEFGLNVTHRRWRSTSWIEAGMDIEDTDYFEPVTDTVVSALPLDFGSFIGAGASTARGFGLSLSRQSGALASFRLQNRRYLGGLEEGMERTHWRLTGRTRAYQALDWFGFAPPTLALRLDGGLESSEAAPGFSLGSFSSQTASAGTTSSGSSYALRGYPSGVQSGNRVVTGTAEYRFPISLVDRGIGIFPLSLNRLWGDVFVDGGAAWCPAGCSLRPSSVPASPEPLFSIGAELMVDVTVGFVSALPLRFGVALPVASDGYSARGYLTVGSSF